MDTPKTRNPDEPQLAWVLETGSPIIGLEMATNGSSTVISTQSNTVALVGHDGEVMWSREFDRPVVGIDLSSLGNTIVIGLRTGEIYTLDEEGEELWSYNLHARLEDVHISKSGRYIVVGSRDTYTYFFDSTGLLLWRSKADARIREVATSTSANYVVSASSSKDIFMHDNYSSNMKGSVTWRQSLEGDITKLAISSDGHYIAASATDNMFYYFDKLGKLHWKDNAENAINSIALAPRGDYIAIGVEGGTYPGQVRLYSAKDQLLWRYLTGSGGVRDVAITTNGRYVIAGSGDGVVSLFHNTEKLIWKKKFDTQVNKVRVSARGRFIAAATESGQLHMYNTTDFLLKRQSAHHGLDESSELKFTKPARIVKKMAVVSEAEGAGGDLSMGRTTMVQQRSTARGQPQGHAHAGDSRRAVSRLHLMFYILIVMSIIGFFSFAPVRGGDPSDRLIDPVFGVLLMIVMMVIMLSAWVSKD